MAFKYENGKVIQVSMSHITGEDAKKMLNAKVSKDLSSTIECPIFGCFYCRTQVKEFVAKVKAKKFITVAA